MKLKDQKDAGYDYRQGLILQFDRGSNLLMLLGIDGQKLYLGGNDDKREVMPWCVVACTREEQNSSFQSMAHFIADLLDLGPPERSDRTVERVVMFRLAARPST
jgi:hypothetical protein